MEKTSEELIKKIVENNEKEINYYSKKMNNYIMLLNSGVLSDESKLIINSVIDRFLSLIFYYQQNTLTIMNLLNSEENSFVPDNIYYQKSVNLINHFQILAQNNKITKITIRRIGKKIETLISRENNKNRINNLPRIKKLWKKMNAYNDTNHQIQKLFAYKNYLLSGYQNSSELRNKTRIQKINKRLSTLKRKTGKITRKVNLDIKRNKQKILKKITIQDK